MKKPLLSVAIITKNEEDRLPKTLEAVKDLADEIVVVDSGSTDRTVEIAKSFGAKVFIEPWRGYGPQKNSALKKCKGEWVLFLDADEVPDEDLKEEIKKAVKNPKAEGYMLRRKAVYLGKPLRFVWGKEYLLRLVRRSANPQWEGKIHEKLLVEGRVKKLKKGWLYHHTYRSVVEHFQKSVRYAGLSAEDYFKKGKSPSGIKLFLGPVWSFLKIYLLKGGFLEGRRGLIIAFSYALNSLLKQARLWELTLKQNR